LAGTKETSLTEEKVMFDIDILDEPTELPLQSAEKEEESLCKQRADSIKQGLRA
jgi:hypothetical protein